MVNERREERWVLRLLGNVIVLTAAIVALMFVLFLVLLFVLSGGGD
ncbi:MAG: hypothetical protein QOF45_2412 [Gaiellaceae bacterium]|jgi:hypothetical protein|nr:hypothetical protein [Gaiellaceae bacterium]